jgi:hypothetical protein
MEEWAMKQRHAQTAATLSRALKEFPTLEKGQSVKKPGRMSDGWCGFEMSAGDIEDGGVQPGLHGTAYVTVDRTTGILIAKAAKKIIKKRLAKLGVELRR